MSFFGGRSAQVDIEESAGNGETHAESKYSDIVTYQ